jgi:imidazolonepropionase-like amidohydrolase
MTPSPAPILIQHGRVIDGLGNPAIEADVLLEAGSIRAVGAEASALAAGRNDIARIDASAKTVMPGLIDTHCHVTFDEPSSNDELFYHRREGLAAMIAARNVRKLLHAGVTGFLDPDSIFDVGIDLRDAIEAGIVEGPRMACGGNALFTSVGGTAGAMIPDQGRAGYAVVTRTRDDIVAETRRQIKKGADWIKVHVTGIIPRQQEKGEIQVWTLDELKVVVDTAHDLGIPVLGHCRNASSTRDAAVAGFDMILHATHMDEEALEAVATRKVPLSPSLTFQANLADHAGKIGADENLVSIFRKEIAESAVMLRRAYDAGVPLLSGSESGFSITPYGEWHFREMQVFVEDLGLTPLQAIKSATSDAAFGLKASGKTGAIEAGRWADVIVVDGRPDEDVRVLGDKSRIHHVIVGGRAVALDVTLPERGKVPGWTVSAYSAKTLTWALANHVIGADSKGFSGPLP